MERYRNMYLKNNTFRHIKDVSPFMKVACVTFAFLLLICTLSLLLCSCGDKYEKVIPKSTSDDLRVVMTIGDYEIPLDLYYYYFMNYKNQYDGGDNSYWDDIETNANKAAELEEIRASVIESIKDCAATFDLCLKYDIDPDGKSVKSAVNDVVTDYIENQFGGVEEYLENIESAYMNDSVFRYIMKYFECQTRLYQAIIEAGTIPSDDETVFNYIINGGFCHAKQILIKNDEGENPADNFAKAKEALNSVSTGIDFDTLVAKYGEDMNMITSPDGYYFTHGELIEAFEEAAFALDVGEISGIVESHLGYHIIMRCEIDPEHVVNNFDELKESYLVSKFREKVSSHAKELPVTTKPLYDELTLDYLTSYKK
jgi:hypothetical protein